MSRSPVRALYDTEYAADAIIANGLMALLAASPTPSIGQTTKRESLVNTCPRGQSRFPTRPPMTDLRALLTRAGEALEPFAKIPKLAKIGQTFLRATGRALAQPATAEMEVMQDQGAAGKSRPTQTDVAPPQPAPSPAGAMDDDRLSRIRAWAVENSPANQYKWIDPKTVIELIDELTRLRSAPPVTEEMVAALQFYADPGNYRSSYSDPVTSTGAHRASKVEREQGDRARAALTAALGMEGK